ncbi:hypothetical protein CU044_2194 [Streptomyces sp. L-9-10]|nr:hypothetical protein [Streptomyces sp. L-9-10]RYJ29101.1 hypothetical protein CU044_2194 [Streptomyces sp. L-9-10]
MNGSHGSHAAHDASPDDRAADPLALENAQLRAELAELRAAKDKEER